MKLTRKQVISTLLEIMDSMPDDACGDWRDSLAYAIETMLKYQKIEQIVNQWANGSDLTNSMIAICEVLEDGNGETTVSE